MLPSTTTILTTHNAALPVAVSVGVETSGIDFALELGGSISGQVTRDSDDLPVSGIQVLVWDYSNGMGFGGSQTLADGTYTITGLPPGNYRLMANASGTEYAGEYYDNVTDSNAAVQVLVTEGNDTIGNNFSLGLGGSISGTVLDPYGQPVSAVQVDVHEYNTGTWFGSTQTLPDGSFTLDGLPPGSYRVQVNYDLLPVHHMPMTSDLLRPYL